MCLVIGIGDDLEELGVTADAATVLRRAPTCTGHATRVLLAIVGWLDALMHEDVLPVVAEVIRVHRRWRVQVPLIEEL